MIALLLALAVWTTQPAPDGHPIESAQIDLRREAVVEPIVWEASPTPWFAWEASECGVTFALGEAETRLGARREAVVAIARHRARTGRLEACE